MKRAGKLFLMIVLVLAMVLTSTGVSNVMSVFAESLTSTQSVEEDKEKVNTSTGTEEQQKSKQPSSEKDGKKEEDAAESTTASKAKEETTAKKEETKQEEETTAKKEETKQEATTKQEETVNKEETTKKEEETKKQDNTSNATTAAKKKALRSKAAGEASSTQINLTNYINVAASGIRITIDGQQRTLEEIQKNNLKVPKGAPVEINLEYGAISGLTENTTLVYQLPDAITISEKQSGDVFDGKIVAGKYEITTSGKITIVFTKKYLEDRDGKVEGGKVVVAGHFKKGWGGTPGGDNIIFGKAEVTIPFEEDQVVTQAKLSLKKTSSYNKEDNTITYTVTVKAPADNTQDVPDVIVKDTFTVNGDKLYSNNGRVYQSISVPAGTSFDESKGHWTIGTMRPNDSYTLKYKVKIKDTFFNEIADVKKGIANKAAAYTGETKLKETSVTQKFNNSLNITKSKGTGIIIDAATGKTYIDYTITVEAPANNTNNMTNVKVKDVFSEAKEEIKAYRFFTATLQEGTTTSYLPLPTADLTTKSFDWNIGTMRPGSSAKLTYRAELQDDVWERGQGWEINKNLKNTATVTADGIEKKEAQTTVNLRKVWIWKQGTWQADKNWSNSQGQGLMYFTIHANESTGGGPVLNKNFKFTDELFGNYVYDGNVIVRVYGQGPANKGSVLGTHEFNVDGRTSWEYTPTGNMLGAYYYEFEYYARPVTPGHGGPISNSAGIGVGTGGTSFNHQVTWQGTGSNEYALKKEYLGGVGTGAARWKTAIPSNVYEGSWYSDTLSTNQKFTQEQIDNIKVKLGTKVFDKGREYSVGTTVNTEGKITGFEIIFHTKTEGVTKSNPITIEYESTPDLSGLKEGEVRTFENVGRIHYNEKLYLTAKAQAQYTQYEDFSKAAGDYNAANKQITWYLMLNENSKMSGNATITEKLPDGLKFISAEITERGSEASATAVNVDESTQNTKNVKLNVTGLAGNEEGNKNGYVKIKVITEVTDENFLQENTSKEFKNSAELSYNGGKVETAAIKTIENKALSKEAIHNVSTYPYVKYTITVNPNGYNLLETKDKIDVVDRMSEYMNLMEDSVSVSSKGAALSAGEWSLKNDKENHRFIVTVPDDKPITITYKVAINKPAGETVKLSNAAYYAGHENSGQTNEKTVTVMESSATVTGSLLLYVKKQDAVTAESLTGAEFVLAEVVRSTDGSIVYENGEPKLTNEKTAITDQDGDATFKLDQKTGSDKLYCLYETKAPANYRKSDSKVYLAFKRQSHTDNLSIQYVQNGGSVEMKNTPLGGLIVEKRTVGNQIPSDTYEIAVTAAESNKDKDLAKAKVADETTNTAITSSISAGTLTFSLKAGQRVEVSGLPVGAYSVTENVESRSADAKDAYIATYSDNNMEVKVEQGKKPEVIVTNTYKTELYVLKKDAGADTLLSGAQLAIYKASDIAADGKVKDGAEAVAAWTSTAAPEDLTGKVKAGETYVLVETKAPKDYESAAHILFMVSAEGRIVVADNSAKYYDDTTHTITLNNQKKTGTLLVKKIIEDGEEAAAFDFTVAFTNFNNGKGGKVTVTRNGNDTPKNITEDGKLEIKGLTNNETVKISGIPYGTTYHVEETQQEGYLLTESEGLTGIIGDGEGRQTDAKAVITNTKLDGFVVKKSVVNGQYIPDAEAKDSKKFNFKVTLKRKGQPYTRKFTLKYSDKDESEEVTAPDGIFNFTLKDTQSAVFSNLPSGTIYTVEEEADANYITSVSVNGNNTPQITDNSGDQEAAIAEGSVNPDGSTVEFINTRRLGEFSFTKTVRGNARDKEEDYIFNVQVDGKAFKGTAYIRDTGDLTAVTITDGKLRLKDGQTAVIKEIPSGVSYMISEEQDDRYVTMIDEKITAKKEGLVEEEKVPETQIVNQMIHFNVKKTDLTGREEVAGATLKLYKAEDVNEDGTLKEDAEPLDSWTSEKGQYHDFGPAVKAGESYVLIETAAPDGYTYTANISFTVKEDGTIETRADKEENQPEVDQPEVDRPEIDPTEEDDIYLVKDDITKVSVTKTDITGSKELAGARLLLKDKDNTVIESWISGTEAHVFEKKLIAGEEYTLVEVTAPTGYEVTESITFTVNKDGTVSVDGKEVDDNTVIMKDEETPVGEEGKIVVSKLVTFEGKNQAVNRTFYTALFSDADCTRRISDVKELRCEGAWTAYTVFEHLKEGTYYVAETDENGDKLESSDVCKIVGNGTECKITPTQKLAYAVLENQLVEPGDDFLNTLHELTVTKKVTLGGEPISEKYNGTFYVSLFTDPYYTNRIGDIKELKVENGKSTSVSFLDLANGTYYVAETDETGNPVENSDFGFDVTYDGDIKVSFTEDDKNSALGITNDMTKDHPDYEKYLKEDDDDEDEDEDQDQDENENEEDKDKTNHSTGKKSRSSKTGDNSHIAFYTALAAIALAAGSAEAYRRNRKAKKKNK